ncbi:MAG: ABC transporter permease [Bacteroidota bacterium]
MSIFNLSWKNLLAKPLNTTLSLLLLLFGVGTISILFLLNYQLDRQLKDNVRGIGLIIGANGSPTQIMLSSIYQIGSPTGNITYEEVESFANHPAVKYAIPLSYGDGYNGYRVMGTSPDYLKLYEAEIGQGRIWERPLEVVLGAKVARETQLKIGDTFAIGHGLETHDEYPLTVVGILQDDYSVVDQLILTDSWTLPAVHGHGHDHDHEHEEGHDHEHEEGHDHEHEEGHDHEHEEGHDHEHEAGHDHEHEEGHDHEHEEGHDHEHEEGHEHEHEEGHDHEHVDEGELESPEEITALLLSFAEGKEGMSLLLSGMVNRNPKLKAVLPAAELSYINKQLGVGVGTLRAFALVIMIVSGLSVFISLYNSLKDRRYEMALLRTLGASPNYLLWSVLLEGLILAALGLLFGFLASRAGMWLLSQILTEQYHYDFGAGFFLWKEEGILAILTLGIGLLAAILPAIQAYNTPIAKTLTDA